jgi:hypothetical protein
MESKELASSRRALGTMEKSVEDLIRELSIPKFKK